MAQRGGKGRRGGAVTAEFGGAAVALKSRLHAGMRSARRSPKAMMRSVLLVLIGIFALAFVALWLGGSLPAVRDGLDDFKRERLMAAGFVVERIDVMGEGRLNEADVRAAVGIYEGDYFFGADLNRAQVRTESLPWVDRAVVRRLWPNRIIVQLVETTPYALYQDDGVLYLTASDGSIVAPLSDDEAALPVGLKLFTGPDAAMHAATITELLQSQPGLWNATESLTRHPSGRWDVRLADGTLVRLPLDNTMSALRKLAKIEAATPLLGRYETIDLRLADRLTLTPARPVDA